MAAADEHNEPASESTAWLGPLIDRFEDACKTLPWPEIADFLPAGGPERHRALVELVHVDLERRLKAGLAVGVETYLARFPELARDRAAVLELLAAEFHHRKAAEPHLTAEEYERRFPQFRDELPAVLSRPLYSPGGARE